jgi:hypothetical protein
VGAQLFSDLDRHLPPTPLGGRKSESFFSDMRQGKRKRAKTSQDLVLNDSSDNREKHLLDLSSMELPEGRRILTPDFYNATVKPNIRSGLDTRLIVDTFMCITMFFILIIVAPTLAGASPIAELTMTEISEQTNGHSTDSAHSRIQIDTEEFDNIIMMSERTRSIYPVIPECLGRIPEELGYGSVTKLSPPARHLLGAMGLAVALPAIFMILYGLISIITFLLEKGLVTIRSSFSSYKHIAKNKNPQEKCMLITSPYSTDIRESESNKSLKSKFKHKSQHLESKV